METTVKYNSFILATFHVVIIALTNYLVQIPLNILGYPSNWGVFTFPLIFLSTDLTVRLFNPQKARKVILLAMFPALFLSYLMPLIFSDGSFIGFSDIAEYDSFIGRIALSSFLAYVVGQSMDIYVFSFLKEHPEWWIAPITSTLLGGIIDTLLFFSLAFYNSQDPYFAQYWVQMGALDALFKFSVSLFLSLPLYRYILTRVQRHSCLA